MNVIYFLKSIYKKKKSLLSIYQISEYQFSRVLIGSRNSGISLAIHSFAIGAKMAEFWRKSTRW